MKPDWQPAPSKITDEQVRRLLNTSPDVRMDAAVDLHFEPGRVAAGLRHLVKRKLITTEQAIRISRLLRRSLKDRLLSLIANAAFVAGQNARQRDAYVAGYVRGVQEGANTVARLNHPEMFDDPTNFGDDA